MFKDYFGIADNPFSNTPDPNYLYMSARHQEALAHLQYGVQGSSGFVLLTGEVGTGKTTICRALMERLPDNVDLALCLNPRLSEAELLATICDELAIDTSHCLATSIKDHMDALNHHLLVGYAKGRRAVLVIDEAQNLDNALLEQVRLLTNLETASTKLLQIILIGQPELRDIIDQAELRQLSQRISARYHLEPLDAPEVEEYVRHRLKVAGLDTALMEPGALKEIIRRSSGIPRLINSICERALLGAYAGDKKIIDHTLAQKAADEVLGQSAPATPAGPASGPAAGRFFAAAMAASLVLGTIAVSNRDKPAYAPEIPPAATAPAAPSAVTAMAEEKQLKSPALEQVPAASKAVPRKAEPAAAKKPSTTAVDEAVEVIDRLFAQGAIVRPEKTAKVKTQVAALASNVENKTNPPSDQAPTPAAATPVTLDNLFRHPGVTGGLEAAVVRLFSLWNRKVSVFGGLNPCAQAQAQGLRCLQRKGTWQMLESLNRPALVRLVNSDGVRRYAILIGLTETQAMIEVDGRTITAAKEAIPPLWPGNFLMLWEPLPRLRNNLKAGMQGPDVVRLRQSLEKITGGGESGEAAKDPSPLFDDNLKQRVMAFQKSHDLKEDGIVGTMTQIKLALAISPSPAPVLGAGR